MTPLKRQKRPEEEITSPTATPTPEKKAKTKEVNDQQLSRSPPKVLIRPSKLGAIGNETTPSSETIQDKSQHDPHKSELESNKSELGPDKSEIEPEAEAEAENSLFSRALGRFNDVQNMNTSMH